MVRCLHRSSVLQGQVARTGGGLYSPPLCRQRLFLLYLWRCAGGARHQALLSDMAGNRQKNLSAARAEKSCPPAIAAR